MVTKGNPLLDLHHSKDVNFVVTDLVNNGSANNGVSQNLFHTLKIAFYTL